MTHTHDSGPNGPRHSSTTRPEFDLFHLPAEPVATAERALTLPERFVEFHQLNPAVYATLVRLARRFIEATGKRKLGMQRLIEIARWDHQIATRGEEDFEINNSFCPYYARLVMLREPDLDGVFELRAAREADAWIAAVKHGLVIVP